MGKRKNRTRFLLAALMAVAACRGGPTPPHLGDLGAVDPAVSALIQELVDRVRERPADAGRRASLGMALEANGFAARAVDLYADATTLQPDNPRWWYRLAIVRARSGDLSAALIALARAIERAPDYAPAWWRRGLWLLDLDNRADADAAFRRAIDLDRNDPAGWSGVALVHLRQGDAGAAAAALEQALRARPGDPYALRLLGTAYRRLGRIDDASFALASSAAREPSWRDPWSEDLVQFRRGYAATLKAATELAISGRPGDAIPLLEQLRAERPGDLALLTHLGSVYAAAGRTDDGVRVLESTLAKDPENFDAHLHLATTSLFAGALDRAVTHAARARELRPTHARAAALDALVRWRRDRSPDAVPRLESSIARDPRDTQPRIWLGLILLEQNRPQQALTVFEAAVAQNPLLADALVGMGMALVRLRRLEDAERVLQRAAPLAPEAPRLGEARAMLNAARAGR